MKFLTSVVTFLSVFCMVDCANAALRAGMGAGTNASASRISATNAAARRIPTVYTGSGIAVVNGSTSSSSSSSSSSLSSSETTYMTETECVNAFTECIQDPEVCGQNFEECTTRDLFYAKKPQCNSVLMQCTAAGIERLFGVSDALMATTNSDGEHIYPTDASIIGQFIVAGEISNRYDTGTCVRRYVSCLNKDNVCGADFELCTSDREFKKQRVFCESTLARCQAEGKTELFGSTNTSGNPAAGSRIKVLIEDGAEFAAKNAVSTCRKITDQCILSTCTANPFKCLVNTPEEMMRTADNIDNDDAHIEPIDVDDDDEGITKADVQKFVKASCLDTIGGNKYCHMTYKEHMPTAAEMKDEMNMDEVFTEAYSARINTVTGKIQALADTFDKRAKNKCIETIKSCAMRSCGDGVGSVCYKQTFGSGTITADDAAQTIADSELSYNEIKTGCSAIVNTDKNCQYAAASQKTKSTYDYSFINADTFTSLFPNPETSPLNRDPIGVIESLTSILKNNYNNAAIEQLAKDCKATAESCIRSFCGTDFTGCYRNRTDVMTDTYSTDQSAFDNSMNKVGGVLDFTIVRGLCVSTVKNADKCEEHLKIERVKHSNNGAVNGWGQLRTGTVREAWVDAVSKGYNATEVETDKIQDGCTPSSATATTGGGVFGRGPSGSTCDLNDVQECNTVINGCLYDKPHYISEYDYQVNMVVNTLFQEVLADLELEAQALYNQKLTLEQNMCRAANANGISASGIMAKKDMTSSYRWVKLRSRKIPKNYSTNGLKVSDFGNKDSNDLYGSFCAARVTIQSDMPEIQRYLQTKSNAKDWTSTYFAVGDVFTCGSWIPQDDLEAIATRAACKEVGGEYDESKNECTKDLTVGQKWAIAGASIGGVGLGAGLMELLQTKTGLGGLIKTTGSVTSEQRKISASITSAETALGSNLCTNKADCKNGKSNCLNVVSNWTGEHQIKTYSVASAEGEGNATCTDAKSYLTAAQTWLGVDENGELSADNWWQSGGNGRRTMNAVGATVLGATAGLVTWKSLEAHNEQKLTEAQQEFMDKVGKHIYCYIGTDELGTYGEILETSYEN